MKRFTRILILVIPFSFFMGSYWGFLSFQKKNQPEPSRGEVRILAQKGLFPKTLQDWVFEKHKIRVRVKEFSRDAELLHFIQTQSRDFDLIQVSSYLSMNLIQREFFKPLNKDLIPNFKNISVDFISLDYDPKNEFFAPISWGVNGFIYNKKLVSEPIYSLKEILKHKKLKKKVALMSSSVELLSTVKITHPIVSGWVRNEDEDSLVKTTKLFKDFVRHPDTDLKRLMRKEELWFSQMANGPSAELMKESDQYEFFIPTEKSNLWVALIAVARQSFQSDLAHNFINLLLSPEAAIEIAQLNQQATVLEALNASSLHPMQKASYLRELQLSQISLLTTHEAFRPAWERALEKSLPDLFKTNSTIEGSK